MQGLTGRQQQVLAFVAEWIEHEGYAPTTREIARACGLGSANGAAYVLSRLEAMGYIRRHARRSRGIELTERASSWPGDDLRRSRAALRVHLAMAFEQAHLFTVVGMVRLAADLEGVERLLRLLSERAGQLRALREAAARLERLGGTLDDEERDAVSTFQEIVHQDLGRLDSWMGYLVHEEVMARAGIEQLRDVAEPEDGPGPLVALLGSLSAAERCLAFATEQLDRLRVTAGDTTEFEAEVERLRREEVAAIRRNAQRVARLLNVELLAGD